MKKYFSYLHLTYEDNDNNLTGWLDGYGRDGWEVCGMYGDPAYISKDNIDKLYFIFKRETNCFLG